MLERLLPLVLVIIVVSAECKDLADKLTSVTKGSSGDVSISHPERSAQRLPAT